MSTRRTGLRSRLVVGFLIVSVVTAVVTAATTAAGALVLIATNPIGSRSLGSHLVATTAALGLPESAAIWLVLGAAAVVFTLAIGAGRLLAGRVLRPLGRLAEGAERVANGDLDVRLVVEGDDDELADLVRTFNTMTANLDRSVRELRRLEGQSRRFVADVSHELRTPLTAMTAVTDVLRAQVLDPRSEGGRAVELVIREVQHLDQLVDDLMEISRFDAGIARIDTDFVDAEVALRACLERRGWSGQVTVVVPFAGARGDGSAQVRRRGLKPRRQRVEVRGRARDRDGGSQVVRRPGRHAWS